MDTEKYKNIEKIRTIHDLKTNFDIKDDVLNSLINQISNESYISNVERFFRGYEAEDLFRFIFSALPWVKLITPLDQEQLPIFSKENYQVPDFLIYIENNKLKDFAALVEVKSVNKDKMKLELSEKQVKSLLNFSQVLKKPLLFAIYWRKFNAWTITSIEYFSKNNNKYSLELTDSIKYDLSVIVFDLSYIFQIIYTKIYFNSETNENKVIKYEASSNGTDFIELSPEESVVLDCFLEFDETELIEENGERFKYRKTKNIQVPKTSYIIMRYFKMYSLSFDAKYFLFISHMVHNVVKKLKIKSFYIMPSLRSNTSDDLFKSAFSTADIFKKYKTKPFAK